MHASNKEINIFLKYALGAKKYLEFGCGGSTFLMLYATLADVISVESDPEFLSHLSQNSLIAHALNSPNPYLPPTQLNRDCGFVILMSAQLGRGACL